jgi:DNA-binding MarR family transcriptional regulator
MADAQELVKLMGRFGHAYVRWHRAESERSGGASLGEIQVLQILRCQGSQMMSTIGQCLGVTPRNVTRLVDVLESEGLVQRLADPEDRRVTVVELTDAGQTRAVQLRDKVLPVIAALYEELPEKDRNDLARVIGRLLEGLERRGY